jgi:hypothetical protein
MSVMFVTCPAHTIPLDLVILIIFGEDNEASHTVFSSLLLPHSHFVKMFYLLPCSQTFGVRVFPLICERKLHIHMQQQAKLVLYILIFTLLGS